MNNPGSPVRQRDLGTPAAEQGKMVNIEIDGLQQPSPAPRFSRTRCDMPEAPSTEGADSEDVLRELGLGNDEIAELRRSGALS